ncbi:MAG: DUF4174 domain-containing protein [Roseovarius sp.]|nr:DUF4174 domain-containing protein [Roseovarius sp.]
MKHILTLVFLGLSAIFATAQESGDIVPDAIILPADGINLNDFLWRKRPLVVFADTPADPRFVEQMGYLDAELDALAARDVVVITDTDPAARSAVRQQLRPRGFSLVLIGKDGLIHLRKPAPWRVREITRAIDKLPVRQQELRDARPGRS